MAKNDSVLRLYLKEENKFFLQMVAYLLDNKIGSYTDDPLIDTTKCFVKLTPELAEHIIEIVKNSEDAEEEDWHEPQIPYDGWGEKEDEDFRNHIGQVIILSQFDEPWDSVMEDKIFPEGIKIEFAKDKFELALDVLDDGLFGGEKVDWWDFRELKDSISLLLANGMTEADIFKSLKKKMRTFQNLK